MDIVNQVTCNHIVGDPEVAYVLSTCPRCRGTGVYGGLVFDNDGRIATTSQGPALSQQIRKILTENRRSSGYGFDYSLFTGVIDTSKLVAIRNEVLRCLTYLKTSQDRESRLGFNYMGREKLLSIDDVRAQQDVVDPRNVIVSVFVTSDSGASTNVVVPLRR